MRLLYLLLTALLLAAGSMPAKADGLVTFKKMTLELATKLAQSTLAACRAQGYQVAIAVLDTAGGVQVILRDRFAGPHTPETARRKAWTSINFRANTIDMLELTGPGQPQSGIRHIYDALFVGGGLPVLAGGALVGGIGVSGAPGGDLDHVCALKGIEAITADLEF